MVRAVRPVRPPASTPEADSTKVVTVEVPQQAPATVPMASEVRASFMLGILPSLSVIPAREAVPTSVPMVSNISIMQKVMTRVMAVNQPMRKKSVKSNLNRVVASHVVEGRHKGGTLQGGEGVHVQEDGLTGPVDHGGKPAYPPARRP